MSQEAELHLLKQRIAELEETVETIDRGIGKKEIKLRDQFAMATLNGLMADSSFDETPEFTAHVCYEFADAMMEARTK